MKLFSVSSSSSYRWRPLYLFANNACCVHIYVCLCVRIIRTTRYIYMLYLCVCIYRYLRTRVIRVPAGCARGGGGGDGNGVARRRVNEMFSRGWLRHGVVIYKNVITLSERRRYSVSPGTTRRAVNGCLPYNNNVLTHIYIYMLNSHTIATYYIHII